VNRPVATLLIAPNAFLRQGLVSVLAASRYRVHVAARHRDELRLSPRRHRPALFILASDKSCGSISQDVAAVRREFAEARIVVLASASDLPACDEVLKSGAAAYLLNTATADCLLKCLDLVMTGGVIVLPEGAPSLVPEQERCAPGPQHSESTGDAAVVTPLSKENVRQLSEREKGILRCIVRGESNKHIGRHFAIAEATVKVHMKAILRKVGVRNRTQAAIWAMNHLLPALSPNSTDAALQMNGNVAVLPLPPRSI